ncbi:hypothetical protein IWW57_000637 [Coemansia sp. S610]|nr:hypothetical protein IWW57_000637 [Coemansia sp. S610]
MARFSCCGLVRKSISLVSLLVLLLIFAVVAGLLGFLLVLTFKTPTITPAQATEPGKFQFRAYFLAWQEPFAYEAKVYASLSPNASNHESFFETAQLLWHIEPQQLANRYPVFRSKVNVRIPSQLRSNPNPGQGLYAHIFVQQTGRFNPHPDFTDPYLVSSQIPLVRWSQRTSKSLDTSSSGIPSEDLTPKLLGVDSVSWAIILENHVYTQLTIPSNLQTTRGYSNTGTYNPLLLPNTFTNSRPKEKPLVALRDSQLVADVYQQTIDVDIELSGIRRGWVSVKNILRHKKPVVVEKTVANPLNSAESTTYSFTDWVDDDDAVLNGVLQGLSVPVLIYWAVCLALFCALAPAFIRFAIRLWSTPATRWIGLSRATVATMLTLSALGSMNLLLKRGLVWILFQPEVAAMALVAANLDDMTFAPWVALSRLCSRIFRRKPSPDTASSLSEQQLVLAAESKGELDSTEIDLQPNPYFRRPEPVIAIRREVDEIAMRWIHLLALPVIGLVAVCMLVDQKGKFWSSEFIELVLSWSSLIFQCVAWVPQIVINYKTKSGSLTPVTFNFLELATCVLSTGLTYMTGVDKLGSITIYSNPSLLCHVVIILQRIVYYKRAKQD